MENQTNCLTLLRPLQPRTVKFDAMEETVYYRFEVKKRDGTKVKLRIQEARECDQENALDFFDRFYMHEEAFIRCSGIPHNPEAVKELREIKDGADISVPTLLCCIDKDDNELEIVGCNNFYVAKKGEQFDFKPETPEIKAFFNLVFVMMNVYNIHDHFDVDLYLGGAGLSVDPSYRGCGIATELLRARAILMKRHNIPITGAWFTSAGSQASARKAGYQQVAQISFEEMGRRSGLVFTDVPPMCVYSVLKADQ